jgi:hypothetical protein
MENVESTSKLFCHKGARDIDRAGLAMLETPPPQGRLHAPVPHFELVQMIEGAARKQGLSIAKERFAVGRDRDGFEGTAIFICPAALGTWTRSRTPSPGWPGSCP